MSQIGPIMGSHIRAVSERVRVCASTRATTQERTGLLTTASSCGFCIYNNVMIAAMHALETYPEIVKKIAIVDIGLLFGMAVSG